MDYNFNDLCSLARAGDLENFKGIIAHLFKSGGELSYRNMMDLSYQLLDDHQFEIFSILHQHPLIEDSTLENLINHCLMYEDFESSDFLLNQIKSPLTDLFEGRKIRDAYNNNKIESLIYLVNRFNNKKHTITVFNSLTDDDDWQRDAYSPQEAHHILSSYTGSLLDKESIFLLIPLLHSINLSYLELCKLVSPNEAQEIFCERDGFIKDVFMKGDIVGEGFESSLRRIVREI